MTARRALLLIVIVEAMFCAAAAFAGGKQPNLHFLEGGIITWVNTAQMVILSLAAVAVYRARSSLDDPSGAALWIFVAAGAVYLSLDESFEFHEQMGQFLRQSHLPRPPLVNGWGDVVLATYAIPVLGVCWWFRRELVADREVLTYLIIAGGVLVLSQLIDTFGVHQGRERYWWSVSEESSKLIGFGIILGTLIVKWSKTRAVAEPKLARAA
ncbi:MAG: hypothetical protein ACKVVP_01595 [Chloroflexota bacterium]